MICIEIYFEIEIYYFLYIRKKYNLIVALQINLQLGVFLHCDGQIVQ